MSIRLGWREAQIVDLFGNALAEDDTATDWTFSDIRSIIDIPGPTLFQTLKHLHQKGLVERDSIHGPYRLTKAAR